MSEVIINDSQRLGAALDSQQDDAPHPKGRAITFTSDGEILSRIYDDAWEFRGTQAVGNGKRTDVSFRNRNANPQHKRAIQETLAELYESYKRQYALAPGAPSINNWKYGLYAIASILGSTDWALIDSPQEWKRFKKEVGKLNPSLPFTEKIASALNKLRMTDNIKRFDVSKELSELASHNGIKQHIAIPVGMYAQVLANAINDIETYHPFRHEIARVTKEALDIKRRVEAGESTRTDKYSQNPNIELSMTDDAIKQRAIKSARRLIKHNIPNFKIDLGGEQLGLIQASCLIVTEAFSGVRVGECVSFNKDSYEDKKTENGNIISTLKGETTKSNGGVPKITTWQTHVITKDSLELAQDMLEPIRSLYELQIESRLSSGKYNTDKYRKSLKEIKSAFITPTVSHQKLLYIMSTPSSKIERAIKQWNIVATAKDVEDFDLLNPSWAGELKVGGGMPKLTNHDFRRTFAVFYKRYGFGGSAGIMFQYKQRNINMGAYYANNATLAAMNDILLDSELLDLMTQEGINLGVDIYNDIFNKSDHLSGGGGESIARDKFERAKAGHDVYMTLKEIETLVTNGTLSYVQLATGGICTNPTCERLCDFGMFSSGNNSCKNKIITDKEAKKKARQRDRIVKTFREMNKGNTYQSSILVGLKKNIKSIEITLDTHEIEYQPFDDKIEGVIYDGQA